MRRNYYIDKRFQTKFIARFFLVLVLGAFLSVVVTMLTTRQTLTSSFDGSELVIEKTSLAILPSVVFTSVLTTVVVGIVAIVITLLVSHKIVGPLYRFEKDIAEVTNGNLTKKIKIRDGDQFDAVAENLNAMVRNLNTRVNELKTNVSDLTAHAKRDDMPREFIEELEACKKRFDDNFVL